MQAVSTEIIIYRLDFYYQDINYKYVCICYIYNKQCNQYDVCPIRLNCTLQTTCTVCAHAVLAKCIIAHQIHTQKVVKVSTFLHLSIKSTKPVNPIGIKMPNFMPLHLIILL